MATVEAVNTVAPVLQFVHVDHLHRPVKMTNAAKATVWDAVWQPFGGAHAITGTASLNLRFPGQWFQAETGLHYNWHRSYDPTLGRYTQPDPLGFVDGPSVYGYVRSSPFRHIDPTGRFADELTDPILVVTGGFVLLYQGCKYVWNYMQKSKPRTAPPPPSGCNEDELDYFNQRVNDLCKRQRSCVQGDTELVARGKISNNFLCMKARRDRENKCFSGGDKNHQKEISSIWSTIGNCTAYIKGPIDLVPL